MIGDLQQGCKFALKIENQSSSSNQLERNNLINLAGRENRIGRI